MCKRVKTCEPTQLKARFKFRGYLSRPEAASSSHDAQAYATARATQLSPRASQRSLKQDLSSAAISADLELRQAHTMRKHMQPSQNKILVPRCSLDAQAYATARATQLSPRASQRSSKQDLSSAAISTDMELRQAHTMPRCASICRREGKARPNDATKCKRASQRSSKQDLFRGHFSRPGAASSCSSAHRHGRWRGPTCPGGEQSISPPRAALPLVVLHHRWYHRGSPRAGDLATSTGSAFVAAVPVLL